MTTINGLYVRGAIGTAIAIADYLLANFLGGKEEGLDPVVAAVRRARSALRKAREEAAHKPRPGLSRAELPDLLEAIERELAKLREELPLPGRTRKR